MTAPAEIPAYHELLWPALLAVDELGGSASIGAAGTGHVRCEDGGT
jgi:hypothetical protein